MNLRNAMVEIALRICSCLKLHPRGIAISLEQHLNLIMALDRSSPFRAVGSALFGLGPIEIFRSSF